MSLAFKHAKDLQLDIAARMSISYGAATGAQSQINYNDFDRIQLTLLSRFRRLFEEFVWGHLTQYTQFTKIANTTGNITTGSVDRVENIINVFADDLPHPLKTLPQRYNPMWFKGTHIRFWIPGGASGVLRLVPFESVGTITIHHKIWPLPTVYNELAIMPLDSELLILGTIADLLIDAGDNPNQAEKYLAQYNSLLITLQNAQETQDVPLNSYSHQANMDDRGAFDGQGRYFSSW